MIPKCYLCDCELTEENKSSEHLLPNNIGGVLKSKLLLCKQCNSKTGELYDKEIDKFAVFFMSYFDIKKERGSIANFQATDLNNKPVLVTRGRERRYLDVEIVQEENRFILRADSIKRAQQELQRLQKDAKEKNLKLEISEIEEIVVYEKADISYKTVLNPDLYFRAVAKIFLNIYFYKKANDDLLNGIIDFIRFDQENKFGWYVDLELSKRYFNHRPFHIIIIKGDRKQKAIYGYLELFGRMGHAMLLNGKYTGVDFEISYTFDPISKNEIVYSYNFYLKVSVLINLILEKPGPDLNNIYRLD